MIEIKITTENASEMHAELSKLLFGVGAPAPVAQQPAKTMQVVQEETQEEEVEAEAVAEEPKKEPRKRPSRAKAKVEAPVETPKEEPAAEAPKEEPAAEAPKEEPNAEAPKEEPKAEAPKEEPKAEAPKEEAKTDSVEHITMEHLRKAINEKGTTPALSAKIKEMFTSYKVQNLSRLTDEQRAEYYNNIMAL